LFLGQLDYVDKKYEPYYNAEMTEEAKKANAGHAPWISFEDGRVLGQTAGIARYVADLANFTPTDPW
jgi:hypothetical protein